MSNAASSSRLPTVWLDGVSLIAPGILSWQEGVPVLRGESPYLPAPTQLPAPLLLPPAERRRATRVVKLCLALGAQACENAALEAGGLHTVFCSSGADGDTTHAICDTLSSADPMVSPTRFHNSVHNAAAGYWSIAVQCMAPSQVICAHDASFAAGLIEAIVQVHTRGVPVLLLAYDGNYPAPLRACRPIPDMGGIGLVLSPEKSPGSLASLSLELDSDDAGVPAAGSPVMPMEVSDLSLENLGQQIPALAGMGMLKCLAEQVAGRVSLPYLSGMKVHVELQPCQA